MECIVHSFILVCASAVPFNYQLQDHNLKYWLNDEFISCCTCSQQVFRSRTSQNLYEKVIQFQATHQTSLMHTHREIMAHKIETVITLARKRIRPFSKKHHVPHDTSSMCHCHSSNRFKIGQLINYFRSSGVFPPMPRVQHISVWVKVPHTHTHTHTYKRHTHTHIHTYVTFLPDLVQGYRFKEERTEPYYVHKFTLLIPKMT